MKDQELTLAENVSIPAKAGDIGTPLDFGAVIGSEPDVVAKFIIKQDLSGGTSFVGKILTSDDGTTYTEIASTNVIPVAEAVAGAEFATQHLPKGRVSRYIKATVEPVGTFSATGKISVEMEHWSSDRK
ncbi:MAG: hypothetical protein LBD46_08500 [Endomicrobium sp.]|jgi:hypothetical protein|nr:hypothetical protein [Endomicrobium sp.]